MAVGESYLTLAGRGPLLKTKLLGALGVVGAQMFALDALYRHAYGLGGGPNDRVSSVLNLLYVIGWASSAVALRRMRVTGRGVAAAAAYVVQCMGLTLAGLISLNEALDLKVGAASPFYIVVDASWPLSHLFMLFVGVLVWRAGVWRGWRRLPCFVCGLALPAYFAATPLLGEEARFAFVLFVTAGFTLLGKAVLGRGRTNMYAKSFAFILTLALLSACAPGVAAKPADVQSEAAATSKLAGIALPQGAERILDNKTVKESTAPLGALAAGLESPMQVQATEVLGWGGDNYRREQGRRIIAQVQASLQKAGLPTQPVGEPQSAQGNTISFFVAGSAQQQKALVGYWVEGEQLLMLVWGQFGRTAAPGGASNAGGNVLDRVSSAPIGAAPRPNAAGGSMPTFPRLSAQPNQVTGTVLSMSGQPLAGARIRFWRLTPQGAVIEYVARTNAQGVYTLSMPPSEDYRIDNATALVSYGVQRYYLPLRPEGDDGSFFDRDAIDNTRGYVKNFVLPVSGRISPEEDPKEPLSYYGGSVYFRAKVKIVVPNDPDPFITGAANGSNALPEGTRIQLTLTPQGPLLDGSAGRPLSYNLQVRNTGRNAFETNINDIPLGVYTATARVTTPDGNTFTPPLAARIVLAGGISGTFTTDPENPVFFAPRWEDWPMINGNVDAAPLIKRSNKGGAGSVWLEIGG